MTQLYIDILKNIKGIKAFFSTKHGASNGSPYYNRETLQQLGLEDKILAQPQQVHEAKIGIISENDCRIIDEDGSIIQAWSRSEEGSNIRFPRTDGVITDQPGVLLTTVHADCLAIWFYDEEHHAIGLVHAGWRGTLAGIAPKAVKLMQETYGSDPAKIKAAIGPGISQCCFETGPEVIEAFRVHWNFADKYAETAEQHFTRVNAIAGGHVQGNGQLRESAAGKYYIDLKGINFEELLQAGLKQENIEVSSHCTHCEPETFASYRREGGTYMRMGAGICLE